MPIPNPILDDRSYQQLRDELVRRIPVYNPEWTDHNPSDPGITLIELFAYLGENLLYRFNQIPEKSKLEFLRLLKIPLRPAQPARALLELTTDKPDGALVPRESVAKAGDISFTTDTEAVAWPLRPFPMAKLRTPQPDETDDPDVRAEAAARRFRAERDNPGRSVAFYETARLEKTNEPVDYSAAVDRMIWIAALSDDKALASAESPDELAAAQEAIRTKLRDGVLNIGFSPAAEAPPLDEIDGCPGDGSLQPEPAVEWQISTGTMSGATPRYVRLRKVADTTRGLTQQGVIRLRLPRSVDEFGVFSPAPEAVGTGDLPPEIEGDEAGQVVFWLRAYRLDSSGVGSVRYLGFNTVESRQRLRARAEFLGTGTGQPNQTFALVHDSVLKGSLTVEVEEIEGRWASWTAVDGFSASTAADRHYVVDLEAGRVTFGNGLQGLPPPVGRRIRAASYDYGGGAAGNLPADAVTKLSKPPGVKVTNPLRTYGGADREDIERALDRIPGELRRRDRAVTRSDFEELALQTPGAGVARANTLPLFHPQRVNEQSAGVVSVVVWPQDDPLHPNAPLPDRNLLHNVCTWLDRRRLLTTELYVIPPVYRPVAVSVGFEAKDGYGVEEVRNWVELALRQYLAPLPPYGPTGEGWPLGRRVHGPELEAAALQVEGVEFLTGLTLAHQQNGAWNTVPTVPLAKYEVPELAAISVLPGDPLEDPSSAVEPPDSGEEIVPVPVKRTEC